MPRQSVESYIDSLADLERSELVSRWKKAYGAPPFKGARTPTLIRGLAYDYQCKRRGKLKASVSRELLRIAKSGVSSADISHVASRPKAKLGTQLVREWNGRTHTVLVTDAGYVLSGKTYRSLSAVAKAITGAHWSGPRFFGIAG